MCALDCTAVGLYSESYHVAWREEFAKLYSLKTHQDAVFIAAAVATATAAVVASTQWRYTVNIV